MGVEKDKKLAKGFTLLNTFMLIVTVDDTARSGWVLTMFASLGLTWSLLYKGEEKIVI